MDRTNPHLAILIFVLFIVGGFVYSFIAFNRSQMGMSFTSPHDNVEIYLDGQWVGQTPIVIKKVPFGFKNFLFKKEGFQSKEWLYDYKPRSDYTGEIFLSDNSLQAMIIKTAAQRFASGTVFQDQLFTTIGLEGQIETFDSSYQKLWRLSLEEMILKPALLAENLMIVGTYAGTLAVIERETGQLVWQKKLENNVTPIALDNHIIWVLTSGTKLYSFSLAGELLSKDIFPEEILADSVSMIDNLPAFLTTQGDLIRKRDGKWQIRKMTIRGLAREAIITADQICLTTSQGHLYAFDPTGEQVFFVEDSYPDPTTLVLNRNLYVSSKDTFYILDPLSGEVLFQRQLAEEINGLFFSEDQLLVAGKSRFVYFFDLDGQFITTKDVESEVMDIKVISENASLLVTAKDSVSIIQLPGD